MPKKIYPKKKKNKVLSLGKMRSSPSRLHENYFSSMHLHIEYSQGVFNPCTFLYNIILEPEKKSWKLKSQNCWTLFPETFLVPKFRSLFPKTFFPRFFLAVTQKNDAIFHIIRLRFQGHRCESGIAIFKWRFT